MPPLLGLIVSCILVFVCIFGTIMFVKKYPLVDENNIEMIEELRRIQQKEHEEKIAKLNAKLEKEKQLLQKVVKKDK